MIARLIAKSEKNSILGDMIAMQIHGRHSKKLFNSKFLNIIMICFTNFLSEINRQYHTATSDFMKRMAIRSRYGASARSQTNILRWLPQQMNFMLICRVM